MEGLTLRPVRWTALGNGLVLRPLSGMELLEARREAAGLTRRPGDRPMCSNACLLARALYIDGEAEPLFADGQQALMGLTAEEIEHFAGVWDRVRRQAAPLSGEETGVNLSFDPALFARRGAGQ